MRDGDWDALASELVRQNYAFVAIFSVLLWDCLITFHQEVKYVWHCQSRVTKYQFLVCRYCAVGYFIFCSILDTQWALRNPISSRDCKTWFFIHVTSLGLIYVGSQVSLIRKVFNLYGRSTLLATMLFAFHFSHFAATVILTDHIVGSLNFNPICNCRKIHKVTVFVFGTTFLGQCITWTLILRKVPEFHPRFFPMWLRMRTSETRTTLSWGLCLVAILLHASLSFVDQRLAAVYMFTFPIAMFSIGTCRFILQAEKDRVARAKLANAIDAAKDKQWRAVRGAEHSHGGALPIQTQHRQSYPPQQPEKMPRRHSESETPSIRTSEFQAGQHDVDAVVSNFPYLHGAQSHELNRNGRSIVTAITQSLADQSPTSSLYSGTRRSADSWRSGGSRTGSGPSLNASSYLEMEATDAVSRHDVVDDTQSASDIEIGSLQSSSSVNSEELRQFYNATWNVGSFMS